MIDYNISEQNITISHISFHTFFSTLNTYDEKVINIIDIVPHLSPSDLVIFNDKPYLLTTAGTPLTVTPSPVSGLNPLEVRVPMKDFWYLNCNPGCGSEMSIAMRLVNLRSDWLSQAGLKSSSYDRIVQQSCYILDEYDIRNSQQ